MKRSALRLLCLILIAGSAAGTPLAAGDIEVDGSFVSTVATGTAPLGVTSTTKVDNLNADLLDGLDSSELFTAATDGSGSGLDADLLDGLDSSAFARALGNVVRVGKTGGDFTSVQAALDSITTASAANPYLVLVGPGVFNERVVMKPFVDIQGAGEGVTKITQSGSVDPAIGTVAGADDAELRYLTVENSGGSTGVVGVYNINVSPRLVHVTVEVDGSGTLIYGIINEATEVTPSAPELTHVTVTVDGTNNAMGILSQVGANTRMRAVRAEVGGSGSGAKYGVWVASATPVLDDVEVTATSDETAASIFGLTVQDAASAVLRDVRVTVSGGGTRYGVFIYLTELTLRDLEVSVAGDGSTSYGVFNEDATVVLESCSIDSKGGSGTTTGVFYADASGEIRDCTVKATSGAGAQSAVHGFDSTGGPFTVDVQHSRLEGAGAAISAPPAYTVRVGSSQLDGGASGSASYTCVYAYDGAFAELSSTCTSGP